jgi:hypothetical protein
MIDEATKAAAAAAEQQERARQGAGRKRKERWLCLVTHSGWGGAE